jgi:hypothetical protein
MDGSPWSNNTWDFYQADAEINLGETEVEIDYTHNGLKPIRILEVRTEIFQELPSSLGNPVHTVLFEQREPHYEILYRGDHYTQKIKLTVA